MSLSGHSKDVSPKAKCCRTKAINIVRDIIHSSNSLFSVVGRLCCSRKKSSEELRRSFFPKAVIFLNMDFPQRLYKQSEYSL